MTCVEVSASVSAVVVAGIFLSKKCQRSPSLLESVSNEFLKVARTGWDPVRFSLFGIEPAEVNELPEGQI